MSYQVKVTLYAATMFVVLAGGVLFSWAYLEIKHADEQRDFIDCIRAESDDGDELPVQQVVDSSISFCEGELWMVR